MKIKFKYIAVSLFVITAIAIFIIYRCTFYYPDITVKVNGLYIQPPEIYHLDNEYYRNYKGNIYNLETNESIYSTINEKTIAREFDNLLWVYDNESSDNLKAIDSTGEVIKNFSISKNIKDFSISNNAVLGISSNGIEIFKLSDSSNAKKIKFDYEYLTESEYNHCKVYQYKSEYGICLKFEMNSDYGNDSYWSINLENDLIGMGNTGYNYSNLLSYNDNKMAFGRAWSETFVEYSFVNKTEKKYDTDIRMECFEKQMFYADSECSILIGQLCVARALKHAPVDTSDEMRYHKNDVLLVYDANDFSQYSERYTKTFERIIYADSEKAITYYNGKYITYDIQSWEKLDKQKATEIKKGGSYIFEQCDDYIFVFDEGSGEMLNRIQLV